MIKNLQVLVLVAGFLGLSTAVAHHRWPVNESVLITVTGTVSAFSWANPHPMIALTVEREDGATEEWNIGGPAVNRMEANGWTKDTVKPGDVITGTGYQFLDGSKTIRLEKVLLTDGSEILVYGRR